MQTPQLLETLFLTLVLKSRQNMDPLYHYWIMQGHTMGVTQFQLATTPTGSVANTGAETTNNVVATSQVPPRLNLVPISLV